MTLRMVFERDDLQRVRVVTGPDPMWELVLSLHRVRDRRVPAHHLPWKQQIQHRVRSDDYTRRFLGMLFALVPQRGNFPDFLTPAGLPAEIGAGCEAVACTPGHRLRTDLGAVFPGSVPSWLRRLAAGDRDQLQNVAGALRKTYDMLISSHWQNVRDTVTADRAARVSTLARDGVSALLASVPGVRGWDGTVLEVAYPIPRTVRLTGRGLTLVPSYFCAGGPVTLIDAELPPVLIYPADRIARRAPRSTSPQLVALLGRTRAESLGALTTPHTTSALASRLGTSIGTASKQAAVLREAGLVSSVRHGNAILHHLTRLGAALLAAELTEGNRM